ncbi:MAG: dihydroorotate dehydrogenase electron transfer subunit [Candidatus Omnitrophota bacterium]
MHSHNIINKKIKIIDNTRVCNNYYKLILDSSVIAKLAQPGQFLHIKINSSFDPLLRRPLSIHRILGGKIEILYELVGRGTKILSESSSGDILDVIGPLGKGFNYQSPQPKADPPQAEITNDKANPNNQLPILIAGGIGVAPLVFLAQKMKQTPIVLIGAKTKNEVLCMKEFKNLGCDVRIATDDGTLGFKGRVTDLLKEFLPANRIYACGPDAMLKSLQKIAAVNNLNCQVSLDEGMGCGIGACLACVINTTKGQKRICHDGPVFDIKELIWEG